LIIIVSSGSILKTLSNIPVFVFAFTCHQNLFSIFNELHGDRKQVETVIVGSNLTALWIYFILAYCGYLAYPNLVQDNIILNFPNSVVTLICRVAVTMLVIFSYPLQIHPCRICIINLLKPVFGYFKWTITEIVYHYSVSLLLFTTTFLVAFFLDDLTTVFSIVGATGSVTLCYILPGLFYVKLKWEKKWTPTKVMAVVLLVFGIVVMINSLTFIIIKAVTKKHD